MKPVFKKTRGGHRPRRGNVSLKVATTPLKAEAELQLDRALDRLLAELVNRYMQGRGEKKP